MAEGSHATGRDGNGSRSQWHAHSSDHASENFERTNDANDGSRPQEQHPPKQKGFGGNNDCGLRKSLRKEVVFAVGSCFRKRKDGGGRLGVARPEGCGRGR
jgi:hypothetical protein